VCPVTDHLTRLRSPLHDDTKRSRKDDTERSCSHVTGIPEAIGVVVGWKVAHAIPTKWLKIALVVVLLALAPYLALRG
jgi:uncharacterized membrane protein YfcA